MALENGQHPANVAGAANLTNAEVAKVIRPIVATHRGDCGLSIPIRHDIQDRFETIADHIRSFGTYACVQFVSEVGVENPPPRKRRLRLMVTSIRSNRTQHSCGGGTSDRSTRVTSFRACGCVRWS